MTPYQNNANKFTNLNIVSFLDSDKMKQIEKVPPLSKYFPEKLCFFIFCKKGKMKISIGGPNRARVLVEGNTPTFFFC
jgi:hypothetical protein